MTTSSLDGNRNPRLAELAQRVLAGGQITPEEGRRLFSLERSADVYDLMAWANRIREQFKGNKIHLCSIVNIKAGGCSENCRFCAQSALYQTESPRYGLVEDDAVLAAAAEAKANGAVGLGLVAAWRGLEEGPVLDELCRQFSQLKESGTLRPDASKCALATLVGALREHGFSVIDCQQATSHLASLGAREIARDAFLDQVATLAAQPPPDWSAMRLEFPDV